MRSKHASYSNVLKAHSDRVCSGIRWVSHDCILLQSKHSFRVCSGIVWVSLEYTLYFQTTIRVYFRILKEYPRCALVYSECTLVCYTFRVCSGIVWVSLEYFLLSLNYYQSIFQNTQRIPKMCFSILWVYSSVLYFQSVLWHSVSKPWMFSVIFKLLSEYILEYSKNTQDVL